MSATPLRIERRDHVALLTLDLPESRNALSGDALFTAFEETFERLDADLDVRVAILTGAGPAFCSGGNVADMRDRTGMFAGSADDITRHYRDGIQRIPRAFERLEVPIIAAVNGPAIGAGNDLACLCDIRIASSAAVFAESFVKVGIVPGDGGCWLLPRVVGASRAAEMALTGDAIDATEALRIGLVSRVVAPDALLAEAWLLASRIASNPSQALRWTKRLLLQGRTGSLDDALVAAGALQGLAHHTDEHAAAVERFFARSRTPRAAAAADRGPASSSTGPSESRLAVTPLPPSRPAR